MGIIVDGLSAYKPVVHKSGDAKAQIRGFHYYSTEFTETDPDYMYVISTDKFTKAFCENCPKHIIISGNIPKACLKKPIRLFRSRRVFRLILSFRQGMRFLHPMTHGITRFSWR